MPRSVIIVPFWLLASQCIRRSDGSLSVQATNLAGSPWPATQCGRGLPANRTGYARYPAPPEPALPALGAPCRPCRPPSGYENCDCPGPYKRLKTSRAGQWSHPDHESSTRCLPRPQKGRIELARGIIHGHDQIEIITKAGKPAEWRAILKHQHAR